MIEDAGTQKYAIGNFLQFQMVKSKDESLQIHEYHKLVNKLKNEDVDLPETLVCGSLIEKLPKSWKDYKNNVKHKRKQMSLEDLILHIRIEEKNYMQDKVIKAKEISSKANVIEGKSSKHYNKSKFSNAKHDNRSQPKHENKLRSTNNWVKVNQQLVKLQEEREVASYAENLGTMHMNAGI